MRLVLQREREIKQNGEPVQTIGNLYVYNDEGVVIQTFATLELPWKNNANMVSCIPKGTYMIELLDSSPSFNYEHYWVRNVEGRSYIKIHRGNYYDQIEGCILIGEYHTNVDDDGVVDVKGSTQALLRLIAEVGKKGELTIQ